MRRRGYTEILSNLDFAKIRKIPVKANERIRPRPFFSLRHRILAIAYLGITGFILHLAVTISQSSYNAEALQEIRDVRYPVQADLLGAMHTLEIIQRELEAGALTRNNELLVTTAVLAEEFRNKLFNVSRLEPKIAQNIHSILEKFDFFYLGSSTLALDLSRPDLEILKFSNRARNTSSMYKDVTGELQILLDEQTRSLSGSIDKANRFYEFTILLAYVEGISGVLVVFFLVWLTANGIVRRINEMVTSLRNIASGSSDMSVRIKIRGKDEMSELAFWFNTFIAKLEAVTSQSTAEIRRIAYTDNLSGLPNRRMLLECLEAEEYRAAKDTGRRVVGMFLDLDNFKPINDQLGHDAGDELIRQVALRLREIVGAESLSNDEVFESMLAGESPIVARIGGDEFFILLSGDIDEAHAQEVAEKILVSVLRPYEIADEQCHIGVSIGVSLSDRDEAGSASLMDEADLAMYEAKNCGKNTYRFYTQEITDAAIHKAQLENALLDCIVNDELRLSYQPKFDLQSGAFVGAEALLRWHSKEFGIMTPEQFIPFAERSGKILEIDQWVLDEVCHKIQHWLSMGIEPGRLAINISPNFARNAGSVELVQSVLEKFSVSSDRLELEITESTADGFVEEVSDNMRRLRNLGVTIALDDFGVGQSSMRLLIHCEIDALKLDRSLVEKIETDYRTRVVVDSLLAMAHSLKVVSVAEGVESVPQLKCLRELGCDLGQGYYFAKPMTADELERFMGGNGHLYDRRIS
ncbi:MAG: EAL domain-containing protein [Gammaproteobacteria bacterium]|nr:EAL domain-containing protein [Gammaproteobacteria bacterium]